MAQEPLRNAIFRQQQRPCIGFDDIACPHRQHHGDVEKRLHLAPGIAGHVPGHRQGQNRAGDGHRQRHRQGTNNDVVVRRVKQRLQIGQRQVVSDRHGEIVEGVKALP